MLVFAAMMIYAAWWLIHAIGKRIVFEAEKPHYGYYALPIFAAFG